MSDSKETLDELRERLVPFGTKLAELSALAIDLMLELLAAETTTERQLIVRALSNMRRTMDTLFLLVLPGDDKVAELARVSREYEEDVLLPFAREEKSRADFYAADVAHSRIAHRVVNDVMDRLGVPESQASTLAQVLDWVDQLHGVEPGTARSMQ